MHGRCSRRSIANDMERCMRRQEFEGHIAAELGLRCPLNLTHPAGADPVDYPVVGYQVAFGDWKERSCIIVRFHFHIQISP